MRRVLAFALWVSLTLPSLAGAAVAVDASSSSSASIGGGGSLSWQHTAQGADRLVVVSLTFGESAWQSLPTVTYAGQTMTLRHAKDHSNGRSAQWSLLNPPTGASTVRLCCSANGDDWVAGAVSFTGVHQGTPLGTAASASGSGASAALTVASAPGELVLDNVSFYDYSAAPTITPASGQSARFNLRQLLRAGGGSTKAGAASVSLGWTSSLTSVNWALAAVAVRPALPPTVSSAPPSSVTASSAALSATASPNGGATTGWFRLFPSGTGGCADSGGTRVPASGGAALGTGATPAGFNQVVSALAADTAYVACAFASSSAGTAAGAPQGFRTLKATGQACTLGSQCEAGACADGVCCDRACTGGCEACNRAGSVGTCSPHPAGADPERACGTGPCAGSCDGARACRYPGSQTSCGVCGACNGGGGCAPVGDGTSCPDGSYCNGEERCIGGQCLPSAPVQCLPQGSDVTRCDELTRSCRVAQSAPPVIVKNARLAATAGRPYRYNARGAIEAAGTGPLAFAACAGPPELHVEPRTGAVSFVPPSAGTVSLCVEASNPLGRDRYAFDVAVGPPSATAPVARAAVNPAAGPAPLSAALDGSGSAADPSAPLELFRWWPGDGRAFLFGSRVATRYELPGGFRPRLTVVDAQGGESTDSAQVQVSDALGHLPPSARLVASATRGEGSLTARLSCDCLAGDAPILSWRWLVSDGRVVSGKEQELSFGPGRYHVWLEVVDANGLAAFDEVELAVSASGKEPPRCQLFSDPPAGAAPLTVTHQASFDDPDGRVVSSELLAADRSGAGPVLVGQYPRAGRSFAKLSVADEDGLWCTALAPVRVTDASGAEAPVIVSAAPRAAACAADWQYAAVAMASPPATFRVEEGPEGLRIDPTTGVVSWTPGPAQVGKHPLRIRATNAAGSDLQELEVEVGPCATQAVPQGCACSTGGEESLLALALGWLLTLSRRRRPRR